VMLELLGTQSKVAALLTEHWHNFATLMGAETLYTKGPDTSSLCVAEAKLSAYQRAEAEKAAKEMVTAFEKLPRWLVEEELRFVVSPKRPVAESPWLQFTSKCQRFGPPPRPNK
jgi:hypothetical protein